MIIATLSMIAIGLAVAAAGIAIVSALSHLTRQNRR